MLNFMSFGLSALVVGPLLVGLSAFTVGQRAPRLAGRVGAITAGIGFAAVVALGIPVTRGYSVQAAVGPLELAADRLAVLLLLLVFGVSATVQAFAVRYLAGDRRAAWFAGGAGLLTAASAGLMAAETLVALAFFWTIAGVALCLLLGIYRELPAARDGVRRTVAAFAIGDLALWIAVALATAAWGRIDLRAVEHGHFSGPLVPVLAVLIVTAALSRSAQIPFHRWLPATLTAPTPVSALLHAGVVNAGGILLIRLAPLAADDLARLLAILAGAATMAYGAVVTLVKPDVKGALVNSTTAQMGFMILTCGLGLWAAAVIHLFAHGFYKSTLFLSSGSAIAHHHRQRSVPEAGQPGTGGRVLRAVTAAVMPAAALLAAVAIVATPSGEHAAEQALLIFAWVTGAAAMQGWLRRRPGIGGAVSGALLLMPAAIAYVAIINAVSAFLDPALPPGMLPASAVWLIAGAALLALGALAVLLRVPAFGRTQRALYAHALTAGQIPVRFSSSDAALIGARS
jgi:NADH:ubiquinone oxidoreductase subunit 5 (subunit L)/multisubunit Na+/H+ antiporter MnhA subunit